MMLLEARFAQAEEALRKAESVSDQRKAKELREDLARLKRVEVIYVSTTHYHACDCLFILLRSTELYTSCYVWLGASCAQAIACHGFCCNWCQPSALCYWKRVPSGCITSLVVPPCNFSKG
jgi:hypothetical protein